MWIKKKDFLANSPQPLLLVWPYLWGWALQDSYGSSVYRTPICSTGPQGRHQRCWECPEDLHKACSVVTKNIEAGLRGWLWKWSDCIRVILVGWSCRSTNYTNIAALSSTSISRLFGRVLDIFSISVKILFIVAPSGSSSSFSSNASDTWILLGTEASWLGTSDLSASCTCAYNLKIRRVKNHAVIGELVQHCWRCLGLVSH